MLRHGGIIVLRCTFLDKGALDQRVYIVGWTWCNWCAMVHISLGLKMRRFVADDSMLKCHFPQEGLKSLVRDLNIF